MYGCIYGGWPQGRRGIIPAIESAHALAHVLKMAQGEYKGKTIVMCLSGRGDKDVHTVQRYINGEETNK